MEDAISKPDAADLLQELTKVNERLAQLSDRLEKLESNGTLETLAELAGVIKAAKDSMTASVTAKSLKTGVSAISLLDEMVQWEGDRLMSVILRASYETREEMRKLDHASDRINLWKLRRLVKNPDMQKSLWFMVLMTKKLSRYLEE
ncbi:hypothetical protein [Effusibacillus lacus]|uniref:DUF1641 domain-containing protein n=1 Tax=Effusibacillus lacus TaxID=1348429 RepID=A0A292YE90_9BACL|nr:hypothetical protein [Effusibacillus lacus]TCS76911.1 hypothetical protein EDD64_101135 [Effusibacillus lacus]GAX91242.1 hypothetical protein EFBL_2908 [Effusibacillus lacus]